MEEQPDDDLFMAWKGMMDMFEPSTPSTRLALTKLFQNSKLSSVEVDPDMWITELVSEGQVDLKVFHIGNVPRATNQSENYTSSVVYQMERTNQKLGATNQS